MKSVTASCLIVALTFALNPVSAQDGDNVDDRGFSLQGALDLFKQSTSPANFEELLNKSDNAVNNLDLNNDGEVDYIRVIDHQGKDVHALVLQVPINEKESRDVAVIEIEKTGSENAILQIKGSEEIFGEDVIAEPVDEKVNTDAFVKDNIDHGPYAPAVEYSVRRVVVNVWFWPSVRFMFGPRYNVWISPYRWGRWPGWYRPWKPLPVYSLRSRRAHYYPSYVFVHVNRVPRAHYVYHEYRRSHHRDRVRAHNYNRGDGSRRRRR